MFLFLCLALILNHRVGYISLIGVFSVVFLLKHSLNTKFDIGIFILAMYLLLYYAFSSFNGFRFTISTAVLYVLAPIPFYLFGKYLVQKYKYDNWIIIAWFIIIVCYCFDVYIVTIQNIFESGQLVSESREFYLSHSEQSQLSATLVGLHADIGMVGLLMFVVMKNRVLRYSFLALFLLSLITTLSLLNRTGIIIALVSFFSVIVYKYRKTPQKIVYSIFILGFILTALFYFNVINTELLEMYNERNADLYTMGDRSDKWAEAIRSLFISPLGWADLSESYYVHNMWLDIARVSGVIPFILLVYITFDSLCKSFFLVRRRGNELSYMLLGLNICFFTSCFVEPIYGGTHFMLYCMLWGTVRELKKQEFSIVHGTVMLC